jgi:hypothetical protein
MEQPRITFVINGNTYSLCATEQQAFGEIPDIDRQHLITLLEAIKRHEVVSSAKAQQAVERAQSLLHDTSGFTSAQQHLPKPERLGSGDAEALMARLVMEEEMKRKPAMTTTSVYKFIAGLAVAVVILILIF